MRPSSAFLLAVCSGLLGIGPACVDGDDDPDTSSAAGDLSGARRGKRLFEQALPGSNGRSCATCHVLDEGTALSVENVEARLAADPGDPLFHPLDADDPTASPLAFEHLKKGLVRIILPLPANMDVIDLHGDVVTPASREIFVWRGVPSIENTAITAPYQLDGRVVDLSLQAQAAITAHSEGPLLARRDLDRIADFERGVFSSPRARFVATLAGLGVPIDQIPNPEAAMHLSPQERRGRDLFVSACSACHGSATGSRIVNRPVHDALFFALKPDGNVIFDVAPGQPPVPRTVPHDGEFLNIGVGLLTGYGQMGAVPAFNDSVDFPRYRFRFYTDGTRTQRVTDLPPIPVTASGEPGDITPGVDENGAPILGPSLGVQYFSTDPGRAAITGNPLDFEAFDVPQLRGIARTAPYFHDSNSGTLREVVDLYSRFILPFVPLNLPPVHPPEVPGIPESLSVAQKEDLIAFLQRL